MVEHEFKAKEDKNGELTIMPNIEKKGNDVIVHMPSMEMIGKFKLQNGKRNIQQI